MQLRVWLARDPGKEVGQGTGRHQTSVEHLGPRNLQADLQMAAFADGERRARLGQLMSLCPGRDRQDEGEQEEGETAGSAHACAPHRARQ